MTSKADFSEQGHRMYVCRAQPDMDNHYCAALQLREIQEVTQRRSGADAVEPQKPLAEILREAKEKKDLAFQEGWKQMKTGKNRPLDEEELEFFDKLAEAEALKRRQENAEEAAELDAFRKAREQEVQDAERSKAAGEEEEKDKKGSLQSVSASSHPRPADAPRPLPKRRKALAAVVRAVPPSANPPHNKSSGTKPIADDDAPTLGGLLGGYSSDSDSA